MKIDDHVWQTEKLANYFLDNIRGALPFAKEQIEIILKVIDKTQKDVTSFLDLGCGNGILGQAILSKYPKSKGVFLDFSNTMIDSAKENVIGDNVIFINDDFGEKKWIDSVKAHAPFDIIVSGLAIHHQEDERKKEIYQEIFNLIKPGGFFMNLEHVSSNSLWVEELIEEIVVDQLYDFNQKKGIKKSKKELSDGFFNESHKSANRLSSVPDQCNWLRDVGFVDVDCFFQFFEVALFGGIRP